MLKFTFYFWHTIHSITFPVVTYSCESWTIKKAEHWRIWCLWAVVLEKAPESSLDSKVIKPVNLKGVQPWIFTGRTDVEAEAPVSWSSDVNRWLIGKVPDAGQDWGQKEKRMRWLDCITDAMNMNLGQLREMVGDREAWCAVVHGVTKSRTWLGNWATTITTK